MKILLFNILISICFLNKGSFCQNSNKPQLDTNYVNKIIEKARKFGWNSPDSQLYYAKQALTASATINYKKGMLSSYQLMASAEYINGNYSNGLQAAKKGLIIAQWLNDKQALRTINNSIGLLYQQMGKYKESIAYFKNSIEYLDIEKYPEAYASTCNNLANSYYMIRDFDNMFKYRSIALKIRKEKRLISALADTYNDIGEYYLYLNKLDSAEYYFYACFRIKDSIGDLEMKALSSLNLGNVYLRKTDYDKAEHYLLICKELAYKISAPYYLQDALHKLVEVYEYKKDLATENNLLKHLLQLKDSLYNVENQKQLNRLFTEFETEKKELEIKNLKITQEEEKKRNRLIYSFFSIGLIFLILFLAFVYNRYKVIKKQKIEIETQKKIVEVKNKEILDSINYASIIQKALITGNQKIEEYLLKKLNFSDYFIFFKPKDIVSGDFYWATETEKGFYIAICDSTGHGVPGAFMSLLNINLLNEAINIRGFTMPNEIFSFIRQQLIYNLSTEAEKKDGMDGTLFYFQFHEEKKFLYASAFNAPIIVRNNELIPLECDRMPVGQSEHSQDFTLFSFQLQDNDWLYAFSDGFSDQFGGNEKKRLKKKAFYNLLTEISSYNGKKQKEKLSHFLSQWKGNEEQVDDILILGIKI
ncbi:MAG: SpoIIE family protein phosphatase [Bacteroidales bacterium]|nr:SpoIIE family protein phosphatase [Bacteroidales bacterium]